MSVWRDMQQRSFYEASARERARCLVDEGTFRELCGPDKGFHSPYLPALGQAVAFDDGVVAGVGRIRHRPVFVIAQEGRFIGGSVGEVGGAKIAGVFRAALRLYEKLSEKYPDQEHRHPAILFAFETGGVRLHEANAGLLAHAEVVELIQRCREKIPMLALIGSKVGCFGGMGFVAACCDAIIMNELGRLGLTGPEVIEEVMGKREFDSSDRALVYRTTGAKHRMIMGDCPFLVKDTFHAFRGQVLSTLSLPKENLAKLRNVGTLALVEEQMALVKRAIELKPRDAMDFWRFYGNEHPEALVDMDVETFLASASVRKRGQA